MIELTRLNGNPLVLNSDLIKSAEASPDTMITLLTGEKLIVKESCAEVVQRIVAFRAKLFAEVSILLSPNADSLRLLSAVALSGALATEAAVNTTGLHPETVQHRRRREEEEEE
jgi:flagellar protein FlbD